MASKKPSSKKPTSTKASPKKTTRKKVVPKKTKSAKAIPKKIIPQIEPEEVAISGDCRCKQKRPNGKYFCFRLVQGRWVQSSAVPFPTQELCEEANC
jgi:hypothetical protein